MNFHRSIVAIGAVLIAHAIGAMGIYWLFGWYDTFMHFAGGFAAGVLAIDIWHSLVIELRAKYPWVIRGLFVIGIVALIGAVWEIHEFILDEIHGREAWLQPGVADTMKDLTMDLFGGLLAYVAIRRK